MLKLGADESIENKRGQTSLMIACEQGNEDIVKTLLDRQKIVIDKPDKEGETSLMYACKFNKPNICRMLLKRGADVKIKNSKGKSSLMIAGEYGNEKVVQVLLDEKGSEIGLTEIENVLKYAEDHRKSKIVEIIQNWKDESESKSISDEFENELDDEVFMKELIENVEKLELLEKKLKRLENNNSKGIT